MLMLLNVLQNAADRADYRQLRVMTIGWTDLIEMSLHIIYITSG
jgi:hypothetical protein